MRKNKEKPRDFYADDTIWQAVYDQACDELKDAMDLNYLAGQRPSDVLKMRLIDIRDGALEVKQNKTSKKLHILLEVDGVPTQLGQLLDRIKKRDRKVSSLFIVATRGGAPLNKWTLRTTFDDVRTAAAKLATEQNKPDLADSIKAFQFRDIRPKAASETDLAHASMLLGHTDKRITDTVYRRVGETVMPTK